MIYLASQSPRRAELLAQIGVSFQQFSVDIDEAVLPGESPEALVQRLALEKAQAGWTKVNADGLEQAPVLGSDTIVLCDGQVLGKPTDKADGLAMLSLLSAYPHQVLTAVALVGEGSEKCITSINQVRFRSLSEQEMNAYWGTGEPLDKAGGYGIQGAAAVFIESLEGSYSSVMGLPLYETAQLLQQADVKYWNYKEKP